MFFLKIREYCNDDYETIIKLFFETIHTVNAVDYSESQLNAWAPDIDTVKRVNKLDDRLLRDYSIVAEEKGDIIGFGDVNDKGYFDLLYVHKDWQRKGVASLIADDIEAYARQKGFDTITTDTSITAKPFFENRGYVILKKQTVEVRGQLLTNYKMEKILANIEL